jgi:hypothetical protein
VVQGRPLQGTRGWGADYGQDTPEEKPDHLRTIRPKKCIVRWSLKKIIEAADQRVRWSLLKIEVQL